jgi:hypothetical protein
MTSPKSDRIFPPNNGKAIEPGRARGLLQLSLTDTPRPIDELLHQLEQPDGKMWLINAMPARHTRHLVPLYDLPAFWPYWIYFDLHAEALY